MHQESTGDLTQLAFGADRRVATLEFRPTDDYTLADVEDYLDSHPDGWYIEDLADAVGFWNVPHKLTSTLHDFVTVRSR